MSKSITISLFLFFSVFSAFAQDSKSIEIDYQHSLRIPYNSIHFLIGKTGENCFIDVKTMQMENRNGYENTNREFRIDIPNQLFESLYKRVSALDCSSYKYNSLNNHGLDGTFITIRFGYAQTIKTLSVWSPDYKTEERGLIEVQSIIKEVFEIAELRDWY